MWLARFSDGVGVLLAAIETLTTDWPVSLRVWRTANLVNADTGFWHRNANTLIRRANAASSLAAKTRGWKVFDFEAFPDSGTLRDAHHPASAPLLAAVEALLVTARAAAASPQL